MTSKICAKNAFKYAWILIKFLEFDCAQKSTLNPFFLNKKSSLHIETYLTIASSPSN